MPEVPEKGTKETDEVDRGSRKVFNGGSAGKDFETSDEKNYGLGVGDGNSGQGEVQGNSQAITTMDIGRPCGTACFNCKMMKIGCDGEMLCREC